MGRFLLRLYEAFSALVALVFLALMVPPILLALAFMGLDYLIGSPGSRKTDD